MSHYKPYPAYKDSGVEWLGAVPVDWALVPLKFLAVIKNGKDHKEVETADGEFPVIGSGGEFARASQCMFDGESVLLGRKGTIDRPLYVNGPFWSVDTMFYTEIGPKTSAKYFFYCTLTIQFNRYSTNTALPSMTQEVLGQIPFAIPPYATQCAIVDHLDRETVRIDGLINKKTRFIELLREKRQALITRAVTKGLDPNAPMKDSGVEWLGDVPAHWDVTPLKYLATFQSGGTPSKENLQFWDGEIPWASAKDLKKDQLDDTSDHITDLALTSGGATLVPIGTVLVVVRGMILARLFPVVEVLVPMAINQDLKALKAAEILHDRFLAYLLRGFAAESLRRLEEAGHGTKALRMDAWTSMRLTVPPLDEQKKILDSIIATNRRIDTLISTTESSIELLKERRSALITAAVTGQIDLRETV